MGRWAKAILKRSHFKLVFLIIYCKTSLGKLGSLVCFSNKVCVCVCHTGGDPASQVKQVWNCLSRQSSVTDNVTHLTHGCMSIGTFTHCYRSFQSNGLITLDCVKLPGASDHLCSVSPPSCQRHLKVKSAMSRNVSLLI